MRRRLVSRADPRSMQQAPAPEFLRHGCRIESGMTALGAPGCGESGRTVRAPRLSMPVRPPQSTQQGPALATPTYALILRLPVPRTRTSLNKTHTPRISHFGLDAMLGFELT